LVEGILRDPSIILGPAHDVATDLAQLRFKRFVQAPALALLNNDHSSGVTRVNLLVCFMAHTDKYRYSVPDYAAVATGIRA